MPGRRATIWRIEPHTEAKHAILRHYLDAWLPIMTKYNQRVVYIDGFAGPGRYTDGQPGSPVIALQAALQHSYPLRSEIFYLFIEEDQARAQNLTGEIAQLSLVPSNIKIQIEVGKFDDTMTHLLDKIASERTRLAPTFAFIDSFGWSQTPMSVLQRLLANPHCEILVTFIYEEINRFIGVALPNDARDELFATPEWRNIGSIPDPVIRRSRLHDLYQEQLHRYAGARFVRSFEMRNRTNATDLLLFFATNSATGLEKMKEAMWRVAPTGSYSFSDTTNPAQAVLFDLGPDYATLRGLLIQHFGTSAMDIQEIDDFVVQETAFLSSHYRRYVLKVMEDENPPSLRVLSAPPRRRRGTYPPGTRLRFD